MNLSKTMFCAVLVSLLLTTDAVAQKLRINVQGIAQPTP